MCYNSGMKHILLISTGGTIACETSDSGLSPAIGADGLLSYVPEIRSLCKVSSIRLYDLDSTNMRPEYWLNIAGCIREHYDEYDGFVITHGTDTMAYAAAMLYYLIQNSEKPIVLTGAQIPISMRDTDARENLSGAFIFASDDNASGVRIVFGGKIIDAARARKTRTKSFNAFESVNYPDIGFIRDGKVRYYIPQKAEGPVNFFDRIDPDVLVIKLVPGMRADIFDYAARVCSAVIIESFGVGGIPYYENDDFARKIEKMIFDGVRIVVTTQVPHEGSDMSVYRVGLQIKQKYRIPEAYDMTTEAALAKVMWALPRTATREEFEKLFLSPIGNDTLL